MSLKIQKNNIERKTIYNFKNSEGMNQFKEVTTFTSNFTDCFSEEAPLPSQIQKWHKHLKTSIKNCSKKVRVKKKKFKKCDNFRARINAIHNRNNSELKRSSRHTV